MSEAEANQSAPAFDNRTLIPYLKWIQDNTDPATGAGPTKDAFSEAFPNGSKLRQSLYIGKLAKGDKITGELSLTDAGRELLETGGALPAGDGIGGTDSV